MSSARMFSPTAGPSSSRTSPSERKWLPRTSSRPTRRRSLAITRCARAPGADHRQERHRRDLQRHDRRGPSQPRRRGRIGVRRRGRRNGGSSAVGIERQVAPSCASGGGRAPASRGASCAQPLEQLFAGGPHAAGAERQHHVAFARPRPPAARPPRAGRPPRRRAGGRARAIAPRQRLGADARRSLLGRGIDVREQQHVGLVEGAAEVVPQVPACACSDAAGRAPRCAARRRGGAASRASPGSRSGGGRSRRSPARRRPRRAPGSAGRRR